MVCDLVLLQEHISSIHVLKTDWPVCSKYDNHFRLDNQQNRGELHEHVMNRRFFTLIENEMFTRALKITRKVGIDFDLDILNISYSSRVSEVGLSERDNQSRVVYQKSLVLC